MTWWQKIIILFVGLLVASVIGEMLHLETKHTVLVFLLILIYFAIPSFKK